MKILSFHLDSLFLFLTDLSDLADSERLEGIESSGIQVREYKSNDLSYLVRFLKRNGYFGDSEIKIRSHLYNWFSKGYSCVVALDGNCVVGMGWFCTCSYRKWPTFARFPDLPDKSGLLFTDFVQEEYRGKGIHKMIMKLRNNLMFERGMENSVSFVGVKNFVSVNNYRKVSDKYRLVYNFIIALPKGVRVSLFLNKNRESWVFLT